MESVLLSSEIEMYVETMFPQPISTIGTKQWLEWHQRLQKLNQQALIEASQLRDEQVKETLVTYQKSPILVYEVIMVNIWKHKILPKLLKLDPEPKNTFMAYTILYHEAVCIALLELIMYHANCCDSLGDSSADLLDYACGVSTQLLSAKPKEGGVPESNREELLRQLDELNFDIGIRALSIIRYLAESLAILPLDVCSQMYDTYDVPMLLAELLTTRPWIRNGKQYSAGKWMDWDGEALGQAEAQVWLALRQLLLDPSCKDHYTVTGARRSRLTKLMMMLAPELLDQLSPLIELKQWLSHIAMMEQVANAAKPLLLETVLEIKQEIFQQVGGKWKRMAQEQLPVVFCNDPKTLTENAQMLSQAYNTDLIEKFEVKEKASCEQCGKDAIQRCSRCKTVWYCSRSCQITNWGTHKEICNKTE